MYDEQSTESKAGKLGTRILVSRKDASFLLRHKVEINLKIAEIGVTTQKYANFP